MGLPVIRVTIHVVLIVLKKIIIGEYAKLVRVVHWSSWTLIMSPAVLNDFGIILEL